MIAKMKPCKIELLVDSVDARDLITWTVKDATDDSIIATGAHPGFVGEIAEMAFHRAAASLR